MTAQKITLPETFLAQLQALPSEQIQQVIDFVEFLNRKYVSSQPSQSMVKQPRVLGLHQGMGWISDDFNAPLPDEFLDGRAVRLLLDTHALIWTIFEPEKLSERVTSLFLDRDHEIFLSIVSILFSVNENRVIHN